MLSRAKERKKREKLLWEWSGCYRKQKNWWWKKMERKKRGESFERNIRRPVFGSWR